MSVTRTEPAESAGQVTRDEQAVEREFIGRAWKNIVKKEDSEYKGVEFINLTLDQGIQEVVMKKGNRLQLWPNKKREGKQDADYRVSLLQEVAQSNAS